MKHTRVITRLHAIAVFAAIALAACDGASSGTGLSSMFWTPTADTAFASIRGPLACVVTQTHTDSAMLGKKGGKIHVGPHTVQIAPRSLAADTMIVVTAPAGNYIELQLEPHGLQFNAPVWLTMSYHACESDVRGSLRTVYVDDSRTILEVLPSATDAVRRKVVAPTTHFSGYLLAD